MQHFVFGIHKKMPRIALWTKIRDREKNLNFVLKNSFKFHLVFNSFILLVKYRIRLENNGGFLADHFYFCFQHSQRCFSRNVKLA